MALTVTHRAIVLQRPRAPSDGLLEAVAAGDLRLVTASNAVLVASGDITMSAAGREVARLGAQGLVVHGDLSVDGVVNTVSTSELHVADTLVRLARPLSNSPPPLEAYLEGAGVLLEPPLGDAVERSLRWRRGALGAAALGKAGGASNEPFWEARGGGVRLSRARAVPFAPSGEVAFGLRVNEGEELEVYKRWTDASGGASRVTRVAAFGREPSAGKAYPPPALSLFA